MKNKLVGIAFIAGSIISLNLTFAQKTTETSAALEFKKYQEYLMKGEFDAAKKSLLKSKEYIDQAASHEDTKESQKTLYYKGEIYSNFLSLGMMTQDTTFIKQGGDNPYDVSIAAFKKGYSMKGKFNGDIKDAVFNQKLQLEKFTSMLYTNGNFKEALEIYDVQVQLSDALNMVDSLSLYNGGICAEKASDYAAAGERYKKCAEIGYNVPTTYTYASINFRKAKKTEEAKAIIADGRKKYPLDKEILLEMVNTSLDEGNTAEAEKNLQDAITADPKNKQLYYTIGTIYIDLKQNEKAEAAFMKALEIDPKYADAQYQLGAHYIGMASALKAEANNLKLGDPKYDVLLGQSGEMYKKAITPLEGYIVSAPNDKEVLMILFQIYRNLDNSEKAMEYKKRADAIK